MTEMETLAIDIIEAPVERPLCDWCGRPKIPAPYGNQVVYICDEDCERIHEQEQQR